MNMADRIQSLRKTQGISQEELADRVGVSRQAVSKWESEQSTPDPEKIIALSDYFQVTTDYLLKGIEPVPQAPKGDDASLGSRILYIAATGFILIGLFLGLGGWYEEQTLSTILGAWVMQAVGVGVYFIGRALSSERPSLWVKLLNILGVTFMPLSMLTGQVFGHMLSAYPVNLMQGAAFIVLYLLVGAGSYSILRRGKS